MIFTDTGAWFALTIPDDPNSPAALAWMAQNTQPLFTTDFIVDETLTLIKARGQFPRAVTLGQQFFDGSVAQVYYLTEEDIRQTWQVFTQFADKEWSFTDCSSRVVIEKFGITQAFAFDRHFQQFGTASMVP